MSEEVVENNGNGNRRKREEVDDTDTVTLAEIIEGEAHWRDVAAAVLGGSDNQNCSYDQGYVKRQALYSCLTCNPKNLDPYNAAGICLACSMKCHEGHDLVELYTKRNFRCDCGNKKFPNKACKLQPIKSDYNVENKYNHNFKGDYCTCHRPYPDPDEENDDDDVDMIQCAICEDWFHGHHTENDTVDLESELIETSDFVCGPCTTKCDFLAYYGNLALKTHGMNSSATSEPPLATGSVTKAESNIQVNVTDEKICDDTGVEDGSQDSGIASIKEVNEHDASEIEATPPAEGTCWVESHIADGTMLVGGTWWAHGWRTKLCKCVECMKKYAAVGVQFLIDPDDPLEVYEAKGRQNDLANPDALEQDVIGEALGRLDRVQQIEVVHRYNEMKESIIEMINRVTAAGRAVTPGDVNALFEEIRSNKRRRVEDDYIPPDNCR